MNEQYLRSLIKGKITEVIFEEMFREEGEFTVLPIGYEHTIPELAQYHHYVHVKKVLENIRHAPDFALISQDKTQVYLVEVKYRHEMRQEEVLQISEQLLKRWEPVHLFVASGDGFYFDPCHAIVNNKGNISQLKDSWVEEKQQQEFLSLLHEFIQL